MMFYLCRQPKIWCGSRMRSPAIIDKYLHFLLTVGAERRSAVSHQWDKPMHREWKTWSQIAIIIMRRIRQRPGGDSLLWLEFNETDDEVSHGTFTIETTGISDKENEILADYIFRLFLEMRLKYKISSTTIH
ncbi:MULTISPECIES: hypothetical protein [Methylobacterium]|uniref:hypothetical protein n=1 Tax=Methylobacterium TaxID=407 RepID=UPI0013EB9220|nr:hypothetical protein [Methylobacterium sp. DB0501]NGM34655.1 hypothetical protein [Methylobacterium sp. DB0501]